MRQLPRSAHRGEPAVPSHFEQREQSLPHLSHQVARRIVAIAAIGFTALGCGAARLFLDLPPPATSTTVAAAAGSPRNSPAAGDVQAADSLPPLEQTLERDSVLALLPRDMVGHADWAEALRQGLLRPRSSIHGPRYAKGDAPRFGFDFAQRLNITAATQLLEARLGTCQGLRQGVRINPVFSCA